MIPLRIFLFENKLNKNIELTIVAYNKEEAFNVLSKTVKDDSKWIQKIYPPPAP